IFEETVIDSGQAIGYNPDNGHPDKWDLDSDEESFYPVISRNKEPPTYHIKDLIDARLDQIQQLLKLRDPHLNDQVRRHFTNDQDEKKSIKDNHAYSEEIIPTSTTIICQCGTTPVTRFKHQDPTKTSPREKFLR
ncbi:11090_t:CDS:2, partial [Gigaspora rosea]